MPTISLKIYIVKSNNVKTMQFEQSMIVYDVCRLIRERVPDAAQGDPNEHGLFNPDEDPTKGRWLEQGRTLEYYHLKDGDVLEYRKKIRPLRIKTLDGSIKTILVDDSATVGEITKTVCDRIGIINPEEFCLYPEQETAEMTLRRQQANIRNQKKMDKMREKLHTDDESNWLNIHKSLREQGIDETGILILRKGLYVTDDNVDVNDPIQVNLIFVQSRDRIINGSHPCTKEEACLFAAYQCQVQLGNHNEAKHKPGFLNLTEFLPAEYRKFKAIEKDIFKEHRKLYNMTEINAKYRYIQLCRSLKTYGVTFFLVKEKMRGRNRLVPRLLGITRESVMRVDENTKEVLKTWPLTTVRRWAASPNSFTLDFGDYSENFYSVQTNEGEKISQLIAMYIDIIMQKKKPLHTDMPEDEDEPVIVESDIDSQRARMVTYNPSSIKHGGMESLAQQGIVGHSQMGGSGMEMHGSHSQHPMEMGMGGVKHMPPSMAQNPQLLLAQQNVARICEEGMAVANSICHDLTNPVEVPVLGSDAASVKWKQKTVDVSRQNVNATLAAMLASAASIITQTGVEPEDINYTSVGSAVTTIATNLTELAKAVKMLAALSDSDQDRNNLLGAAQALAEATAKLLNSSKPENIENRQALLTAAGEMGACGGQLLMLAEETEVDIKIQEALVSMAKAVASATAALVSNARNVADKCEDEALQNQVIMAAKQTALATQSLIACTKVLAPTIDSHLCQEQLIEACKMVAGAVEKIVLAAQAACGDDDTLQNLGAAATAVTEALNLLIEQIKQGVQNENSAQYDEACAAILAATDRLFGAMGNAQEMVKQAKILAEATSSLVNAIKREAQEEQDPDAHKRLLDAAKALADATSKMVEAAKVAAKNPNDERAQENLRLAAEHLRSVVNAAATNPLKKKVIRKLQVAAKQASAVSTQLIAASQGAANSNRNDASQSQLTNHCKQVAEQISNLVQAVRLSMQSPDSPSAQLILINTSQAMIPPAGKMVAAAKAAVPTVGDQASALQLGNFAKATASALAELRAASLKAQEVCGSLEIDSAIDMIKNLAKELQEARVEASQGNLYPLPGQTVESCAGELGASSKTVGSSMAQLLTAANQGNENYTGIAARDTSNALQTLADAARCVAAFTKDPQTQEYIIVTAVKVLDQSVSLILEAKRCVQNPGTPNKQMKLAMAAKKVSQALNHMVNCLPGVIEFENAIKNIAQASLALQNQKFPSASGQSYQQLQANLKTAAGSLNVTSSEVVSAARGTPDQQTVVTAHFSENFQELLQSGLMLTGATKNKESREQMLGLLRNSSVASSKLLLAAKALSVDPNGPNVQNQLAAAARNVTDSINSLLNLCSTSGPGQKECDSALRNIEAVAPLLENPNEPQNDQSYFDCLDTITDNSKSLAEAVGQITYTAKKEDYDTFSANVETTAKVVCLLTESAAQAAYLIGVADPHSEAAVPGLVDQQQFLRAQQAIITACENLSHPSVTQEKVLAAATVIAKHTGTLCNACKLASSRTSNPVAKKEFVQFAKEVAGATAEVVKKIKVLASDVSEKNRMECAKATEPLVKAVEGLTTFASSPQFASTPAKISTQARVAQEPIIAGGKNIIRSSTSMLSSAKNLVIDPNDVDMWKLLAQHTKAITDSVRSLMLAIKEKCPGQKECDNAIDTLNESINSIDQAMLAAVSNSLQPSPASSLQGFQEQMLQSVGDIKDNIASLQTASKGEPEKLAHEATKMANFFPIFISASVGAASRTQSQQMQSSLLEQTKTLAEACMQMMYSAKQSGGNFKSTEAHAQVDEGARFMDDAAEELTKLLEKAGAEAGLITGIVDEFNKAQDKLQQLPQGEMKSFSDYQAKTFLTCKVIVKNTQEMISNANNKPSEIISSSRELSGSYNKLVESVQGAVATIDSDEIAGRLQQTVHGLGDSCIQLVRDGAIVQGAPSDKIMKRSLVDQARICSEKVAHILAAVQAGAVGTQACNEAVDTINGIIGDLETASMFATAGALTSEGPRGTFTDHCHNIVETAKVLVEDTKRLVSSAGNTQEHLATAARLAVKTILKESEHVKLGAVSLSADELEAQLLLLNAVRDVAKSLADLIDSTRSASGKSVSDPAMEQLKVSARDMVGKVSSLMKTVKNVEDEAARGVQSLEATIDSIDTELKDFNNRDRPVALDKSQTTPEALVTATRAITLASTKSVAAGNSCKQIDISAAANLSRKAVKDLLVICKGAGLGYGQTDDQVDRVMTAGRECAIAYKTLLEFVHKIIIKPTADSKAKLPVYSREVATTVGEIVKAASDLKEGAGFVDLTDPQVRAEHELLAAAAAIEAAAKKLSELKIPRTSANEDLNFEEQIIEAAKSIAIATKSLVQSARATQRELVSQGKLNNTSTFSEDSLWSDGLVSCAKLVAAATSNLCDAANQVVQGNADEDKLIAAAKAVAAHTAQLLHAAQVKADPHSENNKGLQRAGAQVKRATEQLVKAAEDAVVNVNTDSFGVNVKGDDGAPVGARIAFMKELEKQEQISRKRRELEALERQLVDIRKKDARKK